MTKTVLIAAFVATFSSAAAWAAPTTCAPRPEVLDQLAENHAEAPVGIGFASNGGLLELLTNDSGATWTLIITMPSGRSCMVAAGEDWRSLRHATVVGSGI